jgi:hypothetical protein
MQICAGGVVVVVVLLRFYIQKLCVRFSAGITTILFTSVLPIYVTPGSPDPQLNEELHILYSSQSIIRIMEDETGSARSVKGGEEKYI